MSTSIYMGQSLLIEAYFHIGHLFNTLRPRLSGRHFADDIFKCIFLNENVWTAIEISLKFVPKGPINNIPALVQIMAWRRSGDKPLSEPMMVSLLTHICVTRPQWVNMEISYYLYKESNCGDKSVGRSGYNLGMNLAHTDTDMIIQSIHYTLVIPGLGYASYNLICIQPVHS